jgi:GT2 family glycosyltransferase
VPAAASVVLCAYTLARWDDIRGAVTALQGQTVAPSEVLLIIDHNEELLARCRTDFASCPLALRIEENARERGLSGARNTAIDLCQAALVAFLDDDATPAPDWLEELLRPFEDDAVMAVGGRAEPRWPSGRPSWFPVEFDWVVGCSYRGLPERTESVRNVIGCSMAFRAEVFEQVGGFVEGIGRIGTLPLGCEETELCIRLRQQRPEIDIKYAPASVVSHRVSADRVRPRYFFSRCWSEGLSKAQIGALVGDADGTASERTYVTRTLTSGVARNLAGILRLDLAGLARAVMIVLGLAGTTLGFARGVLRRRRAAQLAPATAR